MLGLMSSPFFNTIYGWFDSFWKIEKGETLSLMSWSTDYRISHEKCLHPVAKLLGISAQIIIQFTSNESNVTKLNF